MAGRRGIGPLRFAFEKFPGADADTIAAGLCRRRTHPGRVHHTPMHPAGFGGTDPEK